MAAKAAGSGAGLLPRSATEQFQKSWHCFFPEMALIVRPVGTVPSPSDTVFRSRRSAQNVLGSRRRSRQRSRHRCCRPSSGSLPWPMQSGSIRCGTSSD